MYNTIETDIATIERLPGNIFQVSIKKGAEIDLAEAKRLIQATNELLDDTVAFRGGVYDLSRITYINEEARGYFASGDEVKGTVVGTAIISNSFLGKIIRNLFITLGEPKKFPVKFFDSPIRAEHWVRTRMTEALESQGLGLSHRIVS